MDRSMHTKAACCANCKYALGANSVFDSVCCNLANDRPQEIAPFVWEQDHTVLPTVVCPFFERRED